MHWVLILAVLLATTLAEKAPTVPVAEPLPYVLGALAMMLLPAALAGLLASCVVRGIRRDLERWPTWLARFSVGQQLHAGLLVLVVGVVNYGLAWPQIVRENFGLRSWILLDDLLVLAPVYVPLLLSWALFYDVDRYLHTLTAADDEPLVGPSRWRYVLLHSRHYLGIVMLPLLVGVGLFDAARYFAPEFSAGPYGWTVSLPLVGLMIVALPLLLANLWKTESLPQGELRERLDRVLRECKLRVRDILVWHTEGRMTNAAVSGFVPGMRYVFLTDRLLEKLDDAEVAAVVRHEAAHVVHHHLILRLMMLGLPLMFWICCEKAAPQVIEQVTHLLGSLGITAYAQQCVLLPGAIALYALVGLGGYCKLLEYEADLYAAGPDGSAMIGALAKITAETGGGRDGWMHPSIRRRIGFLREATREPAVALRFRRAALLAAGLIASGYLLSLGITIFSL